MKVLIIGSANNIFIAQYIENILLKIKPNIDITILNIGESNINSVYESKYIYNKVNIINTKYNNFIVSNIPILRTVYHKFIIQKKIIELGEFDICHIQYVYSFISNTIAKNSKLYKKIIVSYWGSDLLRNNSNQLRKQKMLLEKSNTITLSTKIMIEKFNTFWNGRYINKIQNIKFSLPSLDILEEIQNEYNEEIKAKLNIPKDKIVVACGYNGSEAQQHIKIIESIAKIKNICRDKCIFILPMTYGVKNLEYKVKIEELLKRYNFNYIILDEYLENKELMKVVRVCDIFINAQITDAFSASMQEHLYSKNILISGKWLKYTELDELNVEYVKFNNFDDLDIKLLEVLKRYKYYKEKCNNNTQKIYNISSVNSVRYKWESVLK